jgi:hypothetical protein
MKTQQDIKDMCKKHNHCGGCQYYTSFSGRCVLSHHLYGSPIEWGLEMTPSIAWLSKKLETNEAKKIE